VRSRLSIVLLIAVSIFVTPAARAQDQDRVWVWSRRCPHPTNVALRVRLDGKTIYATVLPLCQWEGRFGDAKASFRFTPVRPLVWYGYRSDEGEGAKDPGDPTPAGTTLEVQFWQAGSEPAVVLLGYVARTGRYIYMNSIHFLSPVEKSIAIMAPGLVLETYPQQKPRRRGKQDR